MGFPTMWYVRPAKPQISLRIRHTGKCIRRLAGKQLVIDLSAYLNRHAHTEYLKNLIL